MRDIIVGRDEEDRKKFGQEGLAFLGRNFVETGGKINLANRILLDLVRPHMILVCGKRGQGKSYTLGVIAEEMVFLPRKYREMLSGVFFDTMGIYWTMKYPNYRQRELLAEWGIEPRGVDTVVFVPEGLMERMKERGIAVDRPLAVAPEELSAIDWIEVFGLEPLSPLAILLSKVWREENRDIDAVLSRLSAMEKKEAEILEELFNTALSWGIFSKKATKTHELLQGGKVMVLDISTLPLMVKHLLIGIIARKIFEARVIARKEEERQRMAVVAGFTREIRRRVAMPWLFIDEAHEFLPPGPPRTPAARELIRIIREGRQPGISLVLATQQPGKIHTDVMTQSDIVISHRVTAEIDIKALDSIMGTYMHMSLAKHLAFLPRLKGAAILLDDNAEKVYRMRIRPRVSWHGGESASLI